MQPGTASHATRIHVLFLFFRDPAPAEIYTLSLHDALPISRPGRGRNRSGTASCTATCCRGRPRTRSGHDRATWGDRKSTRLNSSHTVISYAVFCLKKKKEQ